MHFCRANQHTALHIDASNTSQTDRRSGRNPASASRSGTRGDPSPASLPAKDNQAAQRLGPCCPAMPSPSDSGVREHSFIDQARDQVQQLFKPRPLPWANLGGTHAHDGDGDNGAGGSYAALSPSASLEVCVLRIRLLERARRSVTEQMLRMSHASRLACLCMLHDQGAAGNVFQSGTKEDACLTRHT